MTFSRVRRSVVAAVLAVPLLVGLAVVDDDEADAAFAGAAPASPVNPDLLGVDPVSGGGVEGRVSTSVSDQTWVVRAFAQIDERIFVGGAFTRATNRPFAGAASYDQPFIAAFDLDTNDFITSWRPDLDDAVWTLEVHDGNLIVGGEFDSVNGTAREGLVALDPITGEIVSQFRAEIANDGSSFEPSVRDLEVVGDQIYVVGDFNRLIDANFRHGRTRTARIDAVTGQLDQSWDPRPAGGGVFDISVDTARGQAILTGTFTSVNGSSNTGSAGVVSLADGSTVPGYPVSLNGNWTRSYASVVDGNRYWIAGEQHYLQIRNANNWGFIGCVATGFNSLNRTNCTGSWRGGDNAGGDFQVGEQLGDDVLIFGCHCRGTYWNSITGEDENLADRGGVRLYRSNGSEWDWLPNMTFWNQGPYGAYADTNGCVYIGGDFVGNVDGFGRFCPVISPVQNLTGAAAGPFVSLDWEAPAELGPGVARYDIFRDGTKIGETTATEYVDDTTAPDETYTYTVTVVPNGSSTGIGSQPIQVTTVGDFDGDGLLDSEDPDDDNDGVDDVNDAFPFDPNESADSDGDGVGDNADAFPNDPAETTDSDGDGVGDNADVFPNDPNESADSDGDGVGDNADAFPNDPNESGDADGDGVGDNADTDADNDGIADGAEAPQADFSVQSPVLSIAVDGGSTSSTVDLSATGVAIGDAVTVDAVVADGDLNSNAERFVLDFNDGEATTPAVQTDIQCAGSLRPLTQQFSASVTVVDIGGGTPGLDVRGTTDSSVDDINGCDDVSYRFRISGTVGVAGGDADGDGLVNRLDLDSDGDSIADVIEAGLTDADGDYRIDDLADQGSVSPAPDADGDGIPNHLDLDANGDGTFDIAGTPFAALDTNDDGRVDGDDAQGGTDANGNGVDDAVEGDEPPPPLPPFGTPANVTLATNGVDQVTISWDLVADARGYLVHRDGQFQRFIATGAGSSWVDENVEQGQTYGYVVRAQAPDGTFSAPSPTQTITVGDGPGLPPFGTPANVTVETNGVDQVTVSWERVADTKGYLIHRDGVFQQFVGPAESSWVDTDVTEGETYSYVVRAQAPGNEFSPPSAPQTITVGEGGGVDPLPPFGTPANVVLETNGVDEVTVTWDQVADVKGYLIHRDFQFLRFVPAGTSSFVDDTVVQGETYRYQVRAQAQDDSFSPPSPVERITVQDGVVVDQGPPEVPPNAAVVLNAAGDEATVTWDPAVDDVGVTGYLVHRDFQFLRFVPADQLSFTDVGLEPGTRYRYQVRAQDAAGNTSSPTGLLIVNTP
ncbi:MAG: hypothetical protein AAGD18_00695 [Actinomycetota bacterium]